MSVNTTIVGFRERRSFARQTSPPPHTVAVSPLTHDSRAHTAPSIKGKKKKKNAHVYIILYRVYEHFFLRVSIEMCPRRCAQGGCDGRPAYIRIYLYINISTPKRERNNKKKKPRTIKTPRSINRFLLPHGRRI